MKNIVSQNERELLNEKIENLLNEQSRLVQKSTHPIVKAIIGTFPFAGGVSSLLGDYAQKRQEYRLRKFLFETAQQFESLKIKLEDKIDQDYLLTDEFCAVVETLLIEASRTADKKKIDFMKSFLISCTILDKPDTTWKDLFLNYIKQLSGFHLVILVSFAKIQGKLPSGDRTGGVVIKNTIPLSIHDLIDHSDCTDIILIRTICNDLSNLGLIIDWKFLRSDNTKAQEKYCLSDSGLHFSDFLLKST